MDSSYTEQMDSSYTEQITYIIIMIVIMDSCYSEQITYINNNDSHNG